MKRATKHNSNLYSYLEGTGVLETGNSQAIASAKKEYWKLYKRTWRKARRQSSISYTVLYTKHEAGQVQKNAKKYRTSPTNYIKQAALHGSHIPDNQTIGQIREMFFKYHDTVEHSIGNGGIQRDVGVVLLRTIEHMQQTLFTYITPI